MGFLFDPTFWVIAGICVLLFLWSEADDKRRIRRLLEETDREWNALIIEHQKAIADAYMEGKGFQINLIRR
jgi:hypothetical protein